MAHPLRGDTINNKAKRRILALSVGLFLFAIYLFVYRGGFHSIDEVSILAVTESMVKFGRFNTDQIAWTQWTTSQAEAQGFFGADGHVYSKKGLGLSLAQAPLYWLGLVLPNVGMLQTVSVLNALITAAAGLVMLMFIWRLNYAPSTAVIVVLIFGLATIAFVYAKYLFSEPFAGFLLLLAAYMLFTYRQEGGLRHVAIAGLAAGSSVLVRANNLFLLPVFGLYLLWIVWTAARHQQVLDPAQASDQVQNSTITPYPAWFNAIARSIGPPILVFLATLAIPGIILVGYNWMRSGNPLQTGYDLTLFSPNILLGLYKLLFSPLRGLFVYSPILLLSLPGWWFFRKTHPAEAWLLAGLVGVTIGLFSAWSSGEGLSWGSRFLVPVIPFFMIALAPVVEKVFWAKNQTMANRMTANSPPSASGTQTTGNTRQPASLTLHALCFTFYALLTLSLLVQILGVTINPWVFLAQIQTGFGGEFFLENTAALYDFRFSQIAGQLQSWSVQNSDLVWWQPWGFDGLAFGLTLVLVVFAGWLLWRGFTGEQRGKEANDHSPLLHRSTAPHLVALVLTAAITYFLLARYFITDLQFGPPHDNYTRALNMAVTQANPDDQLVTVAQYHYHVPMNRFKARMPLIGFAQQIWPPPDTALPLLEASMSGLNTWLVTIGLPPASTHNAAEQWFALNAFKATDEWLDEVRLVRYGTTRPTSSRMVNTSLGQEIELIEVKSHDMAQPGQVLPVEFMWQPLSQPRADYNLFLQLLTAAGAPVAQHDSPPSGGYTPTSSWRPGRQIMDRHGLALSPDLQPGNYRLIAGLYEPLSGKRLLTEENSDFVELGEVTIIPAVEAGNQ